MTMNKKVDIEEIIFSYIEEFKFLLFPDQWSSAFLDYSKNEVLALLFIYRQKTANMTEISEFINSPLNTTTGVVNRLEKKMMIERLRSSEDRRIVQIQLTDKAQEFIDEEKKVIQQYIEKILTVITDEEKTAAISIFSKVRTVLQPGKDGLKIEETPVKKIKRIIIE